MLRCFALASFFPFFAEVTAKDLPDPNNWMTLGWVAAAIFGIVGLANQGLELFQRVFPKEKPPAHEKYATKDELLAQVSRIDAEHELEMSRLEGDVDQDMTRIESRFEQWIKQFEGIFHEDRKTREEWSRQIERALGHVETKAEQAAAGKSRK